MRGSCFEVAREHFIAVFRWLSWDQVCQEPRWLVRRFADFASTTDESARIAQWLAWRREAAEWTSDPIAWTEPFSLDQRLCGWWSANEQALDLLEGTSISPANCAYIGRLLRQVPPEARLRGAVQHACIRHSGLGLEAWPNNPELDPLILRRWRRLLRAWRRLRIEGKNLVLRRAHRLGVLPAFLH